MKRMLYVLGQYAQTLSILERQITPALQAAVMTELCSAGTCRLEVSFVDMLATTQ
jgi:hypothetical protein